MKIAVIVLVILLGAGFAALKIAARWAGPASGYTGTALAACPDRPNCVCSMDATPRAAIAPLRYDPAKGDPMQALAEAVRSLPGSEVVLMDGGYLHAVATSRLMGYIDDLECLVMPGGEIHVRSASRLGYSDLGANRARVEALRAAFEGGGK